MRESSHVVRIEKHRAPGGITCLTFEDAEVPENTASPRPLVFTVHGLMSRKERHIELCLDLARAGFLACTLDARFHGERENAEATARLLGIEFAAVFAETVIGTVEDLGALTAYFERDSYGIIGHSMGGYVALKAAVSDPRARVIVSVAGNPDWTRVPPGTVLPPGALDLARRESPLTRAESLFPRPLLLLHGDADPTVPIEGDRALYHVLRDRYASDPERLQFVEYPNGGHEFTPDMAHRAVAWMRRFFLS